ncbi:MAG: hypothetical protein S4CHLAM2_09670 [Chlamydiales bacterium]|nr:hypothetical protein [Chlamydiales bacterium]
MRILSTILLLFPLFSFIQGDEPETRSITEWLGNDLDRPLSFYDHSGDTAIFSVSRPKDISHEEAQAIHDLIQLLLSDGRPDKRAQYENQLAQHGVSVWIQRGPRQPVQAPQSEPVQRYGSRSQTPPQITGDFTKVTEDGIRVRFYGTFNADQEPQVQWLTENYLKAFNKQNRPSYRKEFDRLGIRVEEMPPPAQQPQTYEQQRRAQREARRERIRQQRQREFGK